MRAEQVVIHKDVLEALDYEAASMDQLLKDARVLADVKGASPVTVAELTDYMRMQFFHGDDEAAQAKRLNSRKAASLDVMTSRRLLNAEARRLGLEKTAAYVDRVNAFEESLAFGAFVEKVIAPDYKVKEEEVRAYYDQHGPDYSSPEMLRLRSLAFTTRPAAEDAVAKLRNGADYGWLASTAEGQIGRDAKDVLTFGDQPVTTDSLPEPMQKALANPKAGDTRLYASPDDRFYLVSVQQVIAPTARPFDEVRADISKKLFGEKLLKGIEDYARKLRAASKVETYLKKAE
jgi:hypothetical protein